MAEPLKNSIGPEVLTVLADSFEAVDDGFEGDRLRDLADQLDDLELKERINLIADTIAAERPYRKTLTTVVAVASDDSLDPWAAWPLTSVIERHGVDHPIESLEAMASVTKRFSCEFAIRPFLEHHSDLTFDHLSRWVDDEDEAVRRLVSEGTRPYLPWGPRVASLTDNPQRAITLLDHLRLDPSETVRRSVANHLNDVAKFDPGLVVSTLTGWIGQDPAPEPAMIRHSLRTLVKKGNRDAMSLLGFTTEAEVVVKRFDCEPAAIEIGESITLNATINSSSAAAQKLVVDYVVHHVKANGDTAPKVFKWKTLSLEPGETVELAKSHSVRPITTRVYYSGRHAIDLQVAGQVVGSTGFDLTVS